MARRKREFRVIYRDGDTIRFELPDHLRELFGSVLSELRDVLVNDSEPELKRLYPTAYPDNAELDDEYQRLMHDDLLIRRLDALDLVEASLRKTELSEEEVEGWMGSVNSLRLVLGTRLDVDEGPNDIDEDHPMASVYALYEVLSILMVEIGEVLSEALPPPDPNQIDLGD